MVSLKRNEDESFSEYKSRRAKDQILTTRALRARPVGGGVYSGSTPQYMKAIDKSGKILLPVQYVRVAKGIPFKRISPKYAGKNPTQITAKA